MPTNSKRKRKTAGAPSRARSAVAAAPAKPAAGEDGGKIRAELLRQVKAEVGPFDAVPNKAKTYERLQIGGKTFGYVFMPRASGVQIRIHERFLDLEPKMPTFDFTTSAYGFWFTLKSVKDVPKVARAFKLTADELGKDA